MRLGLRHLSFAALALSAAQAGVPRLITPRGWKPMVQLAGGGDPELAVAQLRTSVDTFDALLNGLSFDEATSGFIDAVRTSLGNFDLEEFHETLPEVDGRWRRLQVAGHQKGRTYTLCQAPKNRPCTIDPQGALGKRFGDLALVLRSRPAPAADQVNYLVRAELGAGVGEIGWSSITGMLEESAILIAGGDPRASSARRDMQERPGTKTRLRLLESHPNLRPEDIEILGTLWEAFPALGDVIHSFGRIEDLLVYDVKGDGSYQQLRISARLRADLIEDTYPELSEFLEGLGQIALVQAQWIDPEGRQLGRFSLDTEGPRLTFGCFVKDGKLLPVENGRVRTDLPARTDDGPRTFRALIDVRSRFNGIESRIQGMEFDWTYTPSAEGANLEARMTKVPRVTMSGAVMGIIPTWAIDAVIPGNLDELTREFLSTACEGNNGQGIRFAIRSRQAKQGAATLGVEAGVEILDSALISFAMRLASLKLLPDAGVRSDIRKLLLELHGGFAKDLERFDRIRRGG